MNDSQSKEPESPRIPANARKPKLSIEDQIRHLESKGISFDLCGKNEAAAHLSEKNYFFKLTAYRKLFEKHVGGENDGRYIALDFGHLTTLASLDQHLREALLPMTLDIEHFVKADLIRRATEAEEEDGYALVRDYHDGLSPRSRRFLEAELSSRLHDEYRGAIIEKYKDDMPLWAFVEVISFGTVIDLIRFCGERWKDDHLKDAHYLLKYVKGIRNASAHGACILNESTLEQGAPPAPPKSLKERRLSIKPFKSGKEEGGRQHPNEADRQHSSCLRNDCPSWIFSQSAHDEPIGNHHKVNRSRKGTAREQSSSFRNLSHHGVKILGVEGR